MGILPLAQRLRPLWLRDVRVLAYHRVLAQFDEADFPFDPELVSATAEDFAWQMRLVSRDYDPITCADLVNAIEHGRRLPARPVLVTFDDGFCDNFEVAFPILRDCKVPATIFLATGYVDAPGTYWFDWVAYVIGKTERSRLRLACIDLTIELGPCAPDRNARRRVATQLLARLKELTDDGRRQVLTELAEQVGVAIGPTQQALSGSLRWDQVREMAAAGIEFGSHTVSHPVLARVGSDTQLREELVDSRRAIEQATGRPVVAFAYPVGGAGAFDARVLHAVRDAGYRVAFSYRAGLNRIAALDLLALRRTAVERYVSRDHFRARLALPEVFAR